MARVGQPVKSLDESDLLQPSATPTEQSTDDIKLSLNRIEELLNRGHQLLYGDEVSAGSDGDEVKGGLSGAVPAENEEVHGLTQQDVGGISSSTKSSHAQPREQPSSYIDDAELSPLTPVSTPTPSAAATPARPRPTDPTPKKRPVVRSRSGSMSQKPISEDAKIEKEMQSLSASARGARLSEIKKKTGKLPALEEGVDENDKPQDVPIESLKARIHRELEDYRRSGPLMRGARSVNPPRKSGVATGNAAAKTAQSAPPPVARSRFGYTVPAKEAETRGPAAAARTTAPRNESRALVTTNTAPAPAVKQAQVRPRTNVPSSGYGRPTTAGPVARPSRGTRLAATAPPAASTAPAARRKVSKLGATTPGTTAAPATTKSKPGARAKRGVSPNGEDDQHSGAAAGGGRSPQRVPVWERLYSHAAEQESVMRRRREQQRKEDRDRANGAAAKTYHAVRPTRYYPNDHRPVPAQETEVTQEPFRPLALDATHDGDARNVSMSTLRLSSNPRLSNPTSVQRRSSGTTNVVPLLRTDDDEEGIYPVPEKTIVHKNAAQVPRQSTPPPPAAGAALTQQSPLGRQAPKGNSVSPVPVPPPQSQVSVVSRPNGKPTKTVSPTPAKRLQLDRPDDDKDFTLLDADDEDDDASPQQIPQFVRPLDLRGIKK